ncbi:MAG: ribosomal protein S18-alanine N-acetyltransferase [Catenisphaera adipataccumulans]|jgi:ribosomal-protein-alanine N-acetyltransferase|uniref:ribosomal protein S18-alanine N-acetyltransferase n=1 Tax=Catenisphaera adipataccumulans TaxID=700500 RepID=UPI003D92D210
MIFRRITPDDIGEVVRLERLCYNVPWTEEDCIREVNDNPFSHGWLMIEEGRILGYAFLWEAYELSEVARIAVDPALRKKGLGYALMQFLLADAREHGCEVMSLECRASNTAGLRLYAKCGFTRTHRSKGYYSDGEDAVVMTKQLKESL